MASLPLLLFLIIVVVIIFAIVKTILLGKKGPGTREMQELSTKIEKGSLAFLGREYSVLLIFIFIIAIALGIFNVQLMIAFLVGAFLSLAAGNIGMRVATKANKKVAQAARKSLSPALHFAFSSGMIASLFAIAFGLVGILTLYLLLGLDPLYGFAFGSSFVALFMRVGGGIFTKSADIGADTVGKVEKNIPEDDPRNPAVIADLVGDNVGDVAGMGSDLFESFVSSIIAAMAIAFAVSQAVYVPLAIACIGTLASIIGSFFVKGNKIHRALLLSFVISAFIVAVASLFILQLNLYFSLLTGLIAAILIGITTNYFTAYNQKPTKDIAFASKHGASLNIIHGLSNGMLSSILPVIIVAAAIVLSFRFSGLYGIAISALGMLSIVSITLASDIYGSISDNSAGISEFCNLKEARKRTEELDEAGNTMAAIGKGFAISSAALTALALVAAYLVIARVNIVDVVKADNIAVLFIGVALPFLFTSFMLKAVAKGSEKLVSNVRTQFRNKKILQGKEEPDYEQCIKITTDSAIRSLALPAILILAVPFVVGFLFGKEALASLLIGSISASFLLALFMANTGASLDNAKKIIELERKDKKEKNEEAHKAAVIGDTVGDPLKDTAGPSLNIIIKLMAITALIFAFLF